MYDPATGILLRRYRQGEAAIPGFLEDYAALTQGLLDLYETQFNIADLDAAVRLTEKQMELFEDREGGGFFNAAADPTLLMQLKEDYDGAEPSGNSVALMNLFRLARMTGRAEFQESGEHALAAFGPRLAATPEGLPQMLAACEFLAGEPREVVLVGDRNAPDTAALLGALFSRFTPHRVVLLVDSPETRRKLAAANPAIEFMEKLGGKAAAYVCREYACQTPVSTAEEFGALIG
jgi:uncharacterized protein YyaL (SSP411 family)